MSYLDENGNPVVDESRWWSFLWPVKPRYKTPPPATSTPPKETEDPPEEQPT